MRADKRAEAERLERESRRQARRDEEMRELAIKLRRKSVHHLVYLKILAWNLAPSQALVVLYLLFIALAQVF